MAAISCGSPARRSGIELRNAWVRSGPILVKYSSSISVRIGPATALTRFPPARSSSLTFHANVPEHDYERVKGRLAHVLLEAMAQLSDSEVSTLFRGYSD